MNINKTLRYSLVVLSCLALVACGSINATGVIAESDNIHAVIVVEKDGRFEVTGIESRIYSQDADTSASILKFDAPEFQVSAVETKCRAAICWSYHLYDDGNKSFAAEVRSRFDRKLLHAFDLLPSDLVGDDSYTISIYLVPPSRSFHDTFEDTKDNGSQFVIAVHLDHELPASNRQKLAFDEREAMAIEMIVHEFIHFVSFKRNTYLELRQLAVASHMEALAKCYGNLSSLETLDEDSKAQRIYLLTNTGTLSGRSGDLAQAHSKANQRLGDQIYKRFTEIKSPTLLGNQVAIGARDKKEMLILNEICQQLLIPTRPI